jgi:hypothetical protein
VLLLANIQIRLGTPILNAPPQVKMEAAAGHATAGTAACTLFGAFQQRH